MCFVHQGRLVWLLRVYYDKGYMVTIYNFSIESIPFSEKMIRLNGTRTNSVKDLTGYSRLDADKTIQRFTKDLLI